MKKIIGNLNYFKKLVDKFDGEDPLSDIEIDQLYNFFLQLDTSLLAMGPHYWLAQVQISKNLRKIEDYKNNTHL